VPPAPPDAGTDVLALGAGVAAGLAAGDADGAPDAAPEPDGTGVADGAGA
jgi:hypothetical protein